MNEAIENSNEVAVNEPMVITGKQAVVTMTTDEKGNRNVHVAYKKSGKEIEFPAEALDIRSMKAKNLEDALTKVSNRIKAPELFEIQEIAGKRALVRIFKNKTNSYAVIVRKGRKPLAFPLKAINLEAMKADTPEDALRKVAWVSNRVEFLPLEAAETAAS